jgi:hypothetical protein
MVRSNLQEDMIMPFLIPELRDTVLDSIWNVHVETGAPLLEFRLFDTQLCDDLDVDWLAGAAEQSGITRDEIDWMLSQKLLRYWTSPKGKEGFLLFSERLAGIVKRLWDSKKYSLEELRHIADDLNTFVETAFIEELAYDSFDISNYDHFQRRAKEMTSFFAEDLAAMESGTHFLEGDQLEAQQAEAAKRLKLWRYVAQKVTTLPEENLPDDLKAAWGKILLELRISDEWSRMFGIDKFVEQIELGYSPEVTLRGWEWKDGVTTFHKPNWDSTLQRLKDTRNEGKVFPLRTPAFNISERGVELLNHPSPQVYAAIYEAYDLEELYRVLNEKGTSLWECDLAASGRGQCAGCGLPFERTTAARKYCSERCRTRTKGKRWRENDPERARQAQAKYYRENYPEGTS